MRLNLPFKYSYILEYCYNTLRSIQKKPLDMFKTHDKKDKEDPFAGRLSGRLCYILRYGALRVGLEVHEGGFVDLDELMGVHMMRHHTLEEVLQEVDTSLSHRKTKRFEKKQVNGRTYVRAMFCRNFEPSHCHEGSKVLTLFQTCIDQVLDNLQDYDLEDFPDEYCISTMIHQLKRRKKLNMSSLNALLVPAVEHLDFDNVYVTSAMIRLIFTRCPNLRVLSLKDCGYIVTDTVVESIVRKLPLLESLVLTACKHLTDKSLKAIVKHGKNLKQLNLSWIKNFTDQGLLDLVVNCENLKHLDIYDIKLGETTRPVLIEAVRQRRITLILKGLQESDPDVTIENPSAMLPNFGKMW